MLVRLELASVVLDCRLNCFSLKDVVDTHCCDIQKSPERTLPKLTRTSLAVEKYTLLPHPPGAQGSEGNISFLLTVTVIFCYLNSVIHGSPGHRFCRKVL